MSKSILLAITAFLLVCGTALAAEFTIPASRRITWDPGVRGGIPDRITICDTLSPVGGNDATQINSALNGCASGQTVYLNAGTYDIDSAITIPSNVTLRGAGTDSTILDVGTDFAVRIGNIGYEVSNDNANAKTISSGGAVGSTQITTSSAHNLSVDDFVLVDQLDDPNGSPVIESTGSTGLCSWCGRSSGGIRAVSQYVQVTAINSSTVFTFTPALYKTYNKTPQIVEVTGMTTEYAGLEDLKIDNGGVSSSTAAHPLLMFYASNSWIKNVHLEAMGTHGFWIMGGLWNQMTESKFSLLGAVPANNKGYGIYYIEGGSAMLFDNNIFYTLLLPIALEGGVSGNVFSYNYFELTYYNDTEWLRQAFGAHGAHPYMNLVEGNWMGDDCAGFLADWIWGSNSHFTLFRNRIYADTSGVEIYQLNDIELEAFSEYYNIVGNVLGSNLISYDRYEVAGQQSFNWPQESVYILGYGEPGCCNLSTGYYESGVRDTMLRHANWDYYNAAVKDCDDASEPGCQSSTNYDYPTDTLPQSLYLTSEPDWWCTESRWSSQSLWAAIDPATPTIKDIPAKIRYDTPGSGCTAVSSVTAGIQGPFILSGGVIQ